MPTTSVKLTPALRRRLHAAARVAGTTPHAFMVQALEREVEAAEDRRAFVESAREAKAQLDRDGKGYALDEVAPWFEALAAGKAAAAPRLRRWRR